MIRTRVDEGSASTSGRCGLRQQSLGCSSDAEFCSHLLSLPVATVPDHGCGTFSHTQSAAGLARLSSRPCRPVSPTRRPRTDLLQQPAVAPGGQETAAIHPFLIGRHLLTGRQAAFLIRPDCRSGAQGDPATRPSTRGMNQRQAGPFHIRRQRAGTFSEPSQTVLRPGWALAGLLQGGAERAFPQRAAPLGRSQSGARLQERERGPGTRASAQRNPQGNRPVACSSGGGGSGAITP
jgi:hypothetical protein